MSSLISTSGAPGPQRSIYRVRCPKCQKLFSVQRSVMLAARAPLRFNCDSTLPGGCGTRFSSSLDWGVTSGDLVVTREVFENRARAVERVPLKAAIQAPCPKCATPNALAALECKSCGIVFSKFKPKSNEGPDAETLPQLVTLWEKVFADYENVELHASFVQACFDADRLPFASQKYARLLSAAPQEEIARSMRDRVQALASFGSITAKAEPPWAFRVPAFNSLALALGGALLVMGWMLPQVPHLAWLGFACIALCVGVRRALRPQP